MIFSQTNYIDELVIAVPHTLTTEVIDEMMIQQCHTN